MAAVLAAASLLTVPAFAAPVSATADHAMMDSGNPVVLSPSLAEGEFDILYQDQDGFETSVTITAVSPEDTIFVSVNTGVDSLRVRQGPGMDYGVICTVPHGSLFPVTGMTEGWYQISCNGRTGYVSSNYVVLSDLSDMDMLVYEAPSAPVVEVPVATPVSSNLSLAQQIVDYALQFKGYPYVYATAGPNTFDCSGFTSYVFAHFGYSLNRSSRDQLKNGVAVSKSELQPADILLFSANGSVVTHVGLYIGEINGVRQFIHASTAKTGVIISDLDSTYYTNHYYAARRII